MAEGTLLAAADGEGLQDDPGADAPRAVDEKGRCQQRGMPAAPHGAPLEGEHHQQGDERRQDGPEQERRQPVAALTGKPAIHQGECDTPHPAPECQRIHGWNPERPGGGHGEGGERRDAQAPEKRQHQLVEDEGAEKTCDKT